MDIIKKSIEMSKEERVKTAIDSLTQAYISLSHLANIDGFYDLRNDTNLVIKVLGKTLPTVLTPKEALVYKGDLERLVIENIEAVSKHFLEED